jgi:hypothetical protein
MANNATVTAGSIVVVCPCFFDDIVVVSSEGSEGKGEEIANASMRVTALLMDGRGKRWCGRRGSFSRCCFGRDAAALDSRGTRIVDCNRAVFSVCV